MVAGEIEIWYPSTGVLSYSGDDKMVVNVDQGLVEYYRALIPKCIDWTQQKYRAHITVVRTGREQPADRTFWAKYDGERIQFLYSPVVRFGTVYIWLNVLCKRLEELRTELGMVVRSEYTRPPEGFENFFHITLANMKEQNASRLRAG